jgi:RHS repeat-associated protein
VDEVFDDMGQSDEVFWLLADHQGTIRDIAESSGTLHKHVEFDSFGNIQYEQYYYANGEPIESLEPVELNDEAFDQFFYWHGMPLEPATGFYHADERDYAPFTGRWTTHDRLGFDSGESNLYRAYGNAPTRPAAPVTSMGVAMSVLPRRVGDPLQCPRLKI